MDIRDKAKKVVPLIVVLVLVGMGVNALMNVGRNENYAPVQPIPFSHKIHAGQNNIPCMYCHAGVEKSRHASVPAMNVCMNCHSVVAQDSPHIKKLKEYVLEKKAPIEWVRVHDLPDHVVFNHKRHLAKGITCETCHGDVKRMDRVRQEKPLTMGWCLNCHRGETAPDFLYASATSSKDGAHEGAMAEKIGRARGPVASTSCYTCHH